MKHVNLDYFKHTGSLLDNQFLESKPEYHVLTTVRRAVDPFAFIAGGFLASKLFDKPYGDVDIYLTHAWNMKAPMRGLVQRTLNIKLEGTMNTWYGDKCDSLGWADIDGQRYNFIFYKNSGSNNPFIEQKLVIASFDLSICRIASDYNVWGYQGQFGSSDVGITFVMDSTFDKTLETGVITINEGLSKRQKEILRDTRLPKYKHRYAEWSFEPQYVAV